MGWINSKIDFAELYDADNKRVIVIDKFRSKKGVNNER